MVELTCDALELAKLLKRYCEDRKCFECKFKSYYGGGCKLSSEPVGWEV